MQSRSADRFGTAASVDRKQHKASQTTIICSSFTKSPRSTSSTSNCNAAVRLAALTLSEWSAQWRRGEHRNWRKLWKSVYREEGGGAGESGSTLKLSTSSSVKPKSMCCGSINESAAVETTAVRLCSYASCIHKEALATATVLFYL